MGWDIALLQQKFNSITYRITGLMFLLVGFTVVLLIYLANVQMAHIFQEYLIGQSQGLNGHMMGMVSRGMMGAHEEWFLSSVHESLKWVGFGIMIGGLGISYAFARSITIPLRELGQAVKEIEQGHLGKKVTVKSKDEIGQLAATFNHMSEALSVNNRLRQRFLADAAHELKTPLAIIQGHLEGMLEDVIAVDKEQLSSLYDETVHLNGLIKDLRDLSLAETGQLTLEKCPSDINQLINKILYMIQPLADEKQIVLQAVLEGQLKISVDVGRITQVLYNLLTNALRYTPVSGQIKIATSSIQLPDQGGVKITIEDSGQGISSDDLPHIFDHFYRADSSRDRRSGGSGIGLAIVRQLVEIHGGKVEVDSILGQGSRFTVYLPAYEPITKA
jgi:two-component system, OmpR family, sensor histidine kinase BaeS